MAETRRRRFKVWLALIAASLVVIVGFWVLFWKAPISTVFGANVVDKGRIARGPVAFETEGCRVWLYRTVLGVPLPEATSVLGSGNWSFIAGDDCSGGEATESVTLPADVSSGSHILCDHEKCFRFELFGEFDGASAPQVVVSVTPADDSTLVFEPGPVSMGGTRWATHDVSLAIGTDDYIQHFELFDRYRLSNGLLIPDEGSISTAYALSADEIGFHSFSINLDELDEGETSGLLRVSVELEPATSGVLPRRLIASATFTYWTNLSANALTAFCVEADHLLSDSSTMDPNRFEQIANSLLPDAEAKRYSAAAEGYRKGAEQHTLDPGEFFDLTERTCEIEYRERWISFP